MVLESDLKVFLSVIPDKVKKGSEFGQLKRNKFKHDHEVQDLELNNDFKINHSDVDVHVYERKSDVVTENDEDSLAKKRKRDFYLGMLNWISDVAKNPCDPAIGSLPENKKWNSYDSEQQWKKILLVREAMLLKRNVDDSPLQSVWQKKQKMHPGMYDDQSGSERLRCSQRLLAKDSVSKTLDQCFSESSSSGCADEDIVDKQSVSTADSICFGGNNTRRKRIPTGPHFQTHVPMFTERDYKGDTKWLGTKIWPLDMPDRNKILIERDPIGKGRQESCGCQFPSSLECVKFHIGEKRKKLKLELGLAFYWWKFNCMGEEVAFSWAYEDQRKFEEVIKLNRLSSEKYFWDELFKCFPRKGREALVSYYFNVFLLRLRGQQNRNMSSIIHSDDDESEFGPICSRFGQTVAQSPGSIFCSPKKPHRNEVGKSRSFVAWMHGQSL